MPTISGTEKPKTFNCPQCGVFLWTEGICDPCKGLETEKDTPSVVENVTYKHDPQKGKVTARKRK